MSKNHETTHDNQSVKVDCKSTEIPERFKSYTEGGTLNLEVKKVDSANVFADEMPDGFTFVGTYSIEEQPDGRGVINFGSTSEHSQ